MINKYVPLAHRN